MPIKPLFKHAVIALAALGALGAGAACAQPYPSRDITFIVAFAPGGVADTLARLVGKGLGEKLGRTVVVENRGGAGGNIAAAAVARAAPDGYTLLVTTTAVAINETLRPEQGIRGERPQADRDRGVVAGGAGHRPGQSGRQPRRFPQKREGQEHHFRLGRRRQRLAYRGRIFLQGDRQDYAVHVPFQGGAPAIAATIGNQVDLMATTLGGGAAAQIAYGKLKGLGVASAKRAAVTPNVPTYAEAGYPFEASSWVGVFAPAGTSPEITAKLNATIEEVMKDPALRQKLTSIGFDPIEGSQAQAESYFKAEVANWGKMVKTLGLSIK